MIFSGVTNLVDFPLGPRDKQKIEPGEAEDDSIDAPPDGDEDDGVDSEAETLPESHSDKEGEAKGPESGGLSTLDGGM